MRRAIVVGVLGFVLVAGPASATVTVSDSDTGRELASFEKAQCKLRGKGAPGKIRFTAFSLPKGAALTLAVFISNFDWHGFGADYPLLYGDQHTIAEVLGGGEPFSNEFPIPGTPPGTVGTGGIKFSSSGKRLSIGAFGLPNEDFSAGVSVTGGAKCKYPKRR